MNRHFVALACVLAALSGGARAENLTSSLTLAPDSAVPGTFSADWRLEHTVAGSFVDTLFVASGLGDRLLEALANVSFRDHANVSFIGGSIAGKPFDLLPNGAVDSTYYAELDSSAPMVITISGVAAPGLAAGTPTITTYSGTVRIGETVVSPAPIPEPPTQALLLAGLGMVGLLVKRRWR